MVKHPTAVATLPVYRCEERRLFLDSRLKTDICLLTDASRKEHNRPMKRKPNTLLPLELAILSASIDFGRSGNPEFHGYAVAKQLQEGGYDRGLTAHGTLYRALDRLQKLGFLSSRWEDPAVAAAEHRPMRRLYQITATGEAAHAEAPVPQPAPATRLSGRLVSS